MNKNTSQRRLKDADVTFHGMNPNPLPMAAQVRQVSFQLEDKGRTQSAHTRQGGLLIMSQHNCLRETFHGLN